MLKVIHITTVHGRYDVRIFHKQCRSIANSGHRVTLLVQDCRGDDKRDGVEIIDLGLAHGNRIQRILFSPWRMYRYLRSTNADIIHFHDPELLPVGFFLKNCKQRVIYDAHEDVPRQILTKYWIHPVARRAVSIIVEIIEKLIAKRLDAVVCATPFIAKRFKKINSMVVNVNNYPIIEEFKPNNIEKPFSRKICYIGGITRERGISEVIEALGILRNVKLIMCGPFESQNYADELRSMAGWRYVDYRGIVGRQEVGEIMSCCMAGIVTFLPSPNHYDSQPNKLFEYMSGGLAVIVSDFPLWRQIIEECACGLCVNPVSPKDIAYGINSLLADEKECRKKGKLGKEAVKVKFNWKNECKKLLNLYEAFK